MHLGSQALLTSSCTHALEMAAIMLHRSDRNRVIVPSYAFTSCAAAFDLHGWEISFADVRPDYLTLDPSSLEEALTPDVGAILHVNYGGFAPDLVQFRDICTKLDIALIEDNAHGLGGRANGQVLGTVGELSTLSFHGTKNLTCGEGGALILPQGSPLEHFAYHVREKGTNRRSFIEGQVDKYTWVSAGSSFVLSEIAAAVLAGNLEAFGGMQQRRRAIFDRYHTLAGWAKAQGFALPPTPMSDIDFAAHIFWIIAPDESTRIALAAHLRDSGIETATHYQALHESPYAESRGFVATGCSTASIASRTLLRLPLYSGLSDSDVEHVIQTVGSFT